jgi:hypothetical protein
VGSFNFTCLANFFGVFAVVTVSLYHIQKPDSPRVFLNVIYIRIFAGIPH